MISTKSKNEKSFESLKGTLGLKNTMEAPKISKVVVNVGIGSFKDPKKKDLAGDRLMKITGQKPAKRGAKTSIAAFKVRENDPVGYQVTLRGQRMYDFLDRLLNIALPRTKDFRGISKDAVDNMGNYTLGLKEHVIFPEVGDEELKDIFGMAVTVVTTAKDKKKALAFLEYVGFPFKKVEEAQETKKRTRKSKK